MVKLLIDLLSLLRSTAPLLTCVAVFVLLSILLAKSIKKHSTIYYIVFALPFLLFAVPFIGRWFGLEMAGFTRVPILGEIMRDYIHMGSLGHPLLIIIMYMGALDIKKPYVKKLMSIRKELSIIVGFPVLTHSLVRVTNNFPNALKFFTNYDEYMATAQVVSVFGTGLRNFSLVLGIIMLALFIPLWVTSFDGVRKRMRNGKWKKLQRWSYVLYATLFIHAMGLQIGGMLNPRGGNAPKPAVVETTVAQNQTQASSAQRESVRPNGGEQQPANTGEPNRQVQEKQKEQAAKPATSGHSSYKSLADVKVSSQARQYIHIFSLLLIYGSYLFFRIRKARLSKK